KVRQQVNELSEKMASRQVNRDPAFQKIAELLPKAAAEMKTAEGNLQKQATKDALPPEQRALQILQQAEQEYEVQVSAQRNAGGEKRRMRCGAPRRTRRATAARRQPTRSGASRMRSSRSNVVRVGAANAISRPRCARPKSWRTIKRRSRRK